MITAPTRAPTVGLPRVAQEFVLVQSELALGPPDGTARLGKLYRAEYDAVAFNGYAGQYRFAPLTPGAPTTSPQAVASRPARRVGPRRVRGRSPCSLR